MKKKIIQRVLIGLLAGITVSYLITIGISLTLNTGSYYPCVPSLAQRAGGEIMAVVIQMLLSAVLGAGFAASSLIWERDDWSILKQTGTYFVAVTPLMMLVAYVCEWMEHSVKGVISYFAIFLVVFIIVWIAQYLSWKKQIGKIDDRLHNQEQGGSL